MLSISILITSCSKQASHTEDTPNTAPNFIQFRDQAAQMQTQKAIAEINKKYEIMHQRHLQNMADSDARLNNFQKNPNAPHNGKQRCLQRFRVHARQMG